MDTKGTRDSLQDFGSDITLEDILSRGSMTDTIEKPADLPTKLLFLDAERVLPKLSVLPAGGKEFVPIQSLQLCNMRR